MSEVGIENALSDYISESAVGKILGYNSKTMGTYRSTKDWKRIPPGWIKVGKNWVLPVREFKAWLAKKQKVA